MPATLIVDDLYSNEEIYKSLEVGNAAGIRVCISNGIVRRAAIMTSSPGLHLLSENPYHDRMEEGVLIYTAAGKTGEQTLSGSNVRLTSQKQDDFPIHGFAQVASRRDKTIGAKRWRYLGLLEYLRHYPDTQLDSEGNVRKVWLFEFGIHREPATVPIAIDTDIARQLLISSRQNAPARPGDDEIIGLAEVSPAVDFARLEGIRRRLLNLEPRQFEHFVKDLLIHCGFNNVCVTKYSADGGVDVNANAGSRLWLFEPGHVQIQARRWLHSVGRKEVAELRGSLAQFARGVVLTTSHFSRAAINEAGEPGKNPIGLVDGSRLAQIVHDENFRL